MAANKPARRMTLRQLLTSSEKCSHDLAEQLHSTLLSRVADCRELSRPVRRRSNYPTVVALSNALRKLGEAEEEIEALVGFLLEELQEIREHARRERFNRR
jgi:NTP pyrophosphatase (non-canonical NTP hydrolase)